VVSIVGSGGVPSVGFGVVIASPDSDAESSKALTSSSASRLEFDISYKLMFASVFYISGVLVGESI
jgi:hypothetical protein